MLKEARDVGEGRYRWKTCKSYAHAKGYKPK